MGRIAKLSFDTAFTELQRISSALAVSAHEALGLMTAVVSAPELIRPSDWLTALLREDGLEDADEAQRAVAAIMAVYNAIVTEMRGGRLEERCASAFETFEQVCEWSVGYIGIVTVDAVWAGDTEALSVIGTISMLAAFDEEGPALRERMKAGAEGYDLVEVSASLALRCAVSAHAYWEDERRALAPSAAAEFGSEPFRREQPKVGRNAPCPCGSGKKYKRCCGAN